ncbi:tyrosine-protein kinase Fgr-like [Dysidea avara]|uniref:tyrosine-protein kinase Fgr-like n=1 Tax=Dysidea avara TaxID=196820 RepID=UPI00331DF34B
MEITIQMVANDARISDQSEKSVDDLKEQRWFFPLLSKCQAEVILRKLSTEDEFGYFIVSNESSSRDYYLSVRRANSNADDVEHVVISHNEDDHSYGIDGKSRYNSVIDVVRSYVESYDHILKPLSGSLDEVTNERIRTTLASNILFHTTF